VSLLKKHILKTLHKHIRASPPAHLRLEGFYLRGATAQRHWRHRPAPLPSAIGATAQRHWRHQGGHMAPFMAVSADQKRKTPQTGRVSDNTLLVFN
jgi:hypothetical protein